MLRTLMVMASLLIVAASANAAFVIQIDTDGLDNSVLTFNPNFSFGGDTTAASQSVGVSGVPGILGNGDSIFGGNGAGLPDTYQYSYTPGTDVDNRVIAAGTPLNNDGDFASGFVTGGTATYRVFAIWPPTNNVSGGLTNYTLTGPGGDLIDINLDQNVPDAQTAEPEWVLIGTADLVAGETYTLSQQPTSANSFVSMRAHSVMFDLVQIPEPTSAALLGLAAVATLSRRRRVRG